MRIWAVLVLASATAAAAPVMTSSTTPHPGIVHEEWTDASVPWTLHLVRIDLTSAEIGLYATAPDQAGVTTSAYAAALSAQVAINGDSFAAAGYVPDGLAVGSSQPWPNTSDDATSAVFHFQRVGERTTAAIEPPEQLTTFASLPVGVEGAVSGRPLLVRAGAVTAQFDCTDPVAIPCEPAPRSAVGLSADGNTLYLVVVDGWETASLGMLDAELASFLVSSHQVDTAIALDPGSSSTLVLDGALASAPSDGVERTVANHLAIKYGSLPEGQLVGFTCKENVFGCGSDTSLKLAGVKVTLDDGRVQTTGSDALYEFDNVTQRLACVTAKKTGYVTKRQCAQVLGNTMTYNSIAMFPGSDALDAGVAADGAVPTGPDAGMPGTGDAGNPLAGPGMGGGCCDAGADPNALVILLVAWFLVRRRGTTV